MNTLRTQNEEHKQRQAFELLFYVLCRTAPVVVLLDECSTMSKEDWAFTDLVLRQLASMQQQQ